MTISGRDLGLLLRQQARQNAPTIYAYVSEVLAEPDTYRARLADTNGVVRFAVPAGITLRIGQAVLLAKPDASGRMRNTAYVYVGPALLTARNTTTLLPYTETVSQEAGTVTLIPAQIELEVGAASVSFSIRGVGFTAAPAYGHAGIMNASPAVVTSSQITVDVEASGAVPPGTYSLTIAGVEYPDFFIVV